jgi:uncharacterized protein (TIGR00251 family)
MAAKKPRAVERAFDPFLQFCNPVTLEFLRNTPAGVELDIRVIPRAKTSEIGGERDGRLLVRLSAPPVDGAANEALIALMADVLGVSRRVVRVVAGERSRQKRLAIAGVSAAEVSGRLHLPRRSPG